MGSDYGPACNTKMMKQLDRKLLYQIKEDQQHLVLLLHPPLTSTTAELDSSVPAASSTHAEDPWQKPGAKPMAALISTALLSKPWTVACKGKHGSKHNPTEPAAKIDLISQIQISLIAKKKPLSYCGKAEVQISLVNLDSPELLR